jgi:hypothetical protein
MPKFVTQIRFLNEFRYPNGDYEVSLKVRDMDMNVKLTRGYLHIRSTIPEQMNNRQDWQIQGVFDLAELAVRRKLAGQPVDVDPDRVIL